VCVCVCTIRRVHAYACAGVRMRGGPFGAPPADRRAPKVPASTHTYGHESVPMFVKCMRTYTCGHVCDVWAPKGPPDVSAADTSYVAHAQSRVSDSARTGARGCGPARAVCGWRAPTGGDPPTHTRPAPRTGRVWVARPYGGRPTHPHTARAPPAQSRVSDSARTCPVDLWSSAYASACVCAGGPSGPHPQTYVYADADTHLRVCLRLHTHIRTPAHVYVCETHTHYGGGS
jgi:hypothetical protein